MLLASSAQKTASRYLNFGAESVLAFALGVCQLSSLVCHSKVLCFLSSTSGIWCLGRELQIFKVGQLEEELQMNEDVFPSSVLKAVVRGVN